MVTQAPLLSHFNPDLPLRVITNTSNYTQYYTAYIAAKVAGYRPCRRLWCYYTNKYSASGPECPAILTETLTGLMALDLREDPLAQATVPRDDPASHLCIIYYFINTNFA